MLTLPIVNVKSSLYDITEAINPPTTVNPKIAAPSVIGIIVVAKPVANFFPCAYPIVVNL